MADAVMLIWMRQSPPRTAGRLIFPRKRRSRACSRSTDNEPHHRSPPCCPRMVKSAPELVSELSIGSRQACRQAPPDQPPTQRQRQWWPAAVTPPAIPFRNQARGSALGLHKDAVERVRKRADKDLRRP